MDAMWDPPRGHDPDAVGPGTGSDAMTAWLTRRQLEHASEGYEPAAARSASIGADCYVDPGYLEVEREQIFRRSWQFLCHEEALREPGSYLTANIQDRSVVAIRGADGELRAFYNVCKHRGHELLEGAGTTRLVTCPYHAWVYDLERPPASGSPLGADRRVRSRRCLPHSGAGGGVLPPRIREPGFAGAVRSRRRRTASPGKSRTTLPTSALSRSPIA